MDNGIRESILRMAAGAIEERVNYEVSRVIENITDPNTKPDAKRTITIKLELKPDVERRHIALTASASSKIEPPAPVATAMVITNDATGEMVVAELTPQIPGQFNMSGGEQAQPKILKLVGTAGN